jgi:hypothetical protein
MTPDSLDVKAGRFVRAIQGHKKVFKEAEMSQNICREIPRETRFDVDHIRADDQSDVMIIDFAAGAGNYPAQRTFQPADDFYADRSANIGVKKAVVRAGIDNGVETLAPGVIVDDLNGENRPPDAFLLWNTWVQIGE